MTTHNRWLGLILLSVFVIATACSSGAQRVTHNLAAPGAAQPATPQQPLSGLMALPAPSALAGQLKSGKPKGASYVPSDLLRQAEEFESGFPHQHVSATGYGGTFAPDWNPGDPSIDGLAFAMYEYDIDGYGGNAALYLSWITPPVSTDTVYVALANWERDAWDWYVDDDSNQIVLPGTSHYINPDGAMLACVVATGTDSSELDWLRLGSVPPEPSLSATPLYGMTPLTVNFDATGSTDTDGTIAEYKWDPEGDGSFDVSTGTDPTYSFEYDGGGDYAPAVRVIDNNGVYQDRTIAITAAGSAGFSYGTADYEEDPYSVVVCDDGHLFSVGYRHPFHGDAQALVTKVSPAGTIDFVKTWGADQPDVLYDVVRGGDSHLYACGTTSSYGVGGGDALLQKWTQDGELNWSRTIGSASGNGNDTEVLTGLVVAGDRIYACGTYQVDQFPRVFGFVLCTDLDGNSVWAHSIRAPGDCQLNDISYASSAHVGEPTVRICGAYEVSAGNYDALYVAYDDAGSLVAAKTWGVPGSNEKATAIAVQGSVIKSVYVSGTQYVDISHTNAFLGKPGGTTVEVVDPYSDLLESASMASSNLLLRRSLLGQYSMVVARFDGSFNLTSQTEVGASPDGSVFAEELTWYGGSGLALTGIQVRQLPVASSIELSVSTSATAWADVTLDQGAPAQLTTNLTPADTQDLTGFELNGEHDFDDAYVYVGSF